MLLGRLAQVELPEVCEMCASVVFRDRNSFWPIGPPLEWPSATSPSTSRSRAVSTSSGPRAQFARDQPRDDRRVDHALAVVDPAQRVRHDRDFRDAVLEQVACSTGYFFEELRGVARVQIVREDEHSRIRVAAANLLSCEQAVVALVWRHADVHYGDVRPPGFDHAQEGIRVAAAAGDLEPGVLEQPREAFAQQRLIIGDHDTHGISRQSSPSRAATVPPAAPTRSWIWVIAPSNGVQVPITIRRRSFSTTASTVTSLSAAAALRLRRSRPRTLLRRGSGHRVARAR